MPSDRSPRDRHLSALQQFHRCIPLLLLAAALADSNNATMLLSPGPKKGCTKISIAAVQLTLNSHRQLSEAWPWVTMHEALARKYAVARLVCGTTPVTQHRTARSAKNMRSVAAMLPIVITHIIHVGTPDRGKMKDRKISDLLVAMLGFMSTLSPQLLSV